MGQIVGFSERQQQEILSQATDFWDTTTQRMSSYFLLVNELERLSRVQLPQDLENAYASFPDRSRLVPPDIFLNLLSVRANLRKMIFRRKPYLKLHRPGMWNRRDDGVDKAEEVLQGISDLENDGKGFPAAADIAIHQTLYAGKTVVVTHWKRKWEKVPERDALHMVRIGQKSKRPIFRQQLVAEYPETESLDIRRCRIDPKAAKVENIRLVGYQSLAEFTELLDLNRNPETHYSFDEEELANSNFDATKYYEYLPGATAASVPDPIPQIESFGGQNVEIWSLRGLFRLPIEGSSGFSYHDLILEIGNRNVILALKENDLPLHGWEMFDYPSLDEQHGRIFTMGIVEPVRDLFIEQFVKRNQSLDSANRNVFNTYVGDSSACADLPDYIDGATDQILKVDTMASNLRRAGDALEVLQRPQLGQDTFAQSQTISREVQQAMRQNDYLQGKDTTGSKETATAVSELVSGGLSLAEQLVEKLTDTYLSPTARKKLRLWNYFNAHKSTDIHTRNGRKLTVEPEEIDKPWMVSVETNIAATSPAMIRRTIEMLPLLWTDPFYDSYELRETVNELLDLPNRERLLPAQDVAERLPELESIILINEPEFGEKWQPHPLENKHRHIKVHKEYLQAAQQQGQDVTALQTHLEQTIAMAEEEQSSLGNTKALGGNSGNLVQPEGASQTRHGIQQTGAFLPKETRA